MNPSPLISAFVNYTHVLQVAQSPQVADWDSHFVDRCAEWCVYIETELSLLSESDLSHCRQEAQKQLDHLSLPSLLILSNALHHFYMTLVANPSVSQDLYRYILSTYLFINDCSSARENVVMDFTRMAKKVVIDNVLYEMERTLMEDGDIGKGG